MSKWSLCVKTKQQLIYAALDAFASALVYRAMMNISGCNQTSAPIPISSQHHSTMQNQGTVIANEQQQLKSRNMKHPQTDVSQGAKATMADCVRANTNKQPNIAECVEVNDEPNRSVKRDVFHLIMKITDEVRGGAGKPLSRLFSVMLSMQFFEESPQDRATQEKAIAGKCNPAQAKHLPRASYRGRVSGMIPQPSVLKRRFLAVIEALRTMQVDGLPFFKSTASAKVSHDLKHIEGGCVSDTPGVPIYRGKAGDRLLCARAQTE